MLEIGTKKVSKNEARDLYDCLIKLDVDTLKKSTSRSKDKRNNILTILNNIKMCVFDNFYFIPTDKPSESEESIAERERERERAKLRRHRYTEIKEKEQHININCLIITLVTIKTKVGRK